MNRIDEEIWKPNEDGFLEKVAEKEKVDDAYKRLIEDTVDLITKEGKGSVHSIYLIGSVARGTSAIGKSDVDFIAVLNEKQDTSAIWNLLNGKKISLLKRYSSLTPKIDIDVVTRDEIITPDHRSFSIMAFVIKTQSISLFGSDLAKQISPFKLTADIPGDDVYQIEVDIKEALDEIRRDQSPVNVGYWSKRISKNFLRAGFGLKCLELGYFTRKCTVCAEVMKDSFPDKVDEIAQALRFSSRPTESFKELEDFLLHINPWIVPKAKEWLRANKLTNEGSLPVKNMKLSFHRVEDKHKKIILQWFEKDHVKEFYYGDGLKNTLRNLDLYISGINSNGQYSFDHWIAYIDGKPLGFLMTSPIVGPLKPDDDFYKWYQEGEKAVTLDLLIGEEEFLGKGLSPRMIREFLLDKFADVSSVFIDPAANNPKAVRVYEKAGFRKLGKFVPAYDPIPHWMMRLDMKDLL